MTCPDINVWLALATPEHAHSAEACAWWDQENGPIAFSRLTQLGLLRIVTTAAAMGGNPLTMDQAWRLYDTFFEDDRVTFLPDPGQGDHEFRRLAAGGLASPKVWNDAWLLALCRNSRAVLVTFDLALKERGATCLLSPL